ILTTPILKQRLILNLKDSFKQLTIFDDFLNNMQKTTNIHSNNLFITSIIIALINSQTTIKQKNTTHNQ
ncbi:hypothetical protein, partial [Klebsiella pneumoniae]|uniref:hypothetical protein n=1 Tax=Klebsiella pneumoniae TaxID=573 RepID=UPI00197AC59C